MKTTLTIPNCFSGNFGNCLYNGLLAEWNVKKMEIEYITHNPAADLRSEYSVTIKTELQQLQATFKGAFFVAIS